MPLIGNLGGVQLAAPGGIDLAKRAVDDLQADAIFIHLNPLQEAVQPEGQTDWRHVLPALETAVRDLDVPVMVKEVGAGIGLTWRSGCSRSGCMLSTSPALAGRTGPD